MEDEISSSTSAIRAMECNLALLQRCDGSAGFCQGKTEVLTAIYGPAEVKLSKELMDKATVECTFKLKSGLTGCQERLTERIIRNTIDTVLLSKLHPRSSITIVCQVIQDDGSLLACALNSVCMACANAGVPMSFMFSAVSCALNENGDIVIDPSIDVIKNSKAQMTTVFESKSKKLLSSETNGTFSVEEYFRCLDACKSASKSVFTFQRECIGRFLSKETTNEQESKTDWFQ